MRLSTEALGRVSGDIGRPAYDRLVEAAGVVHFGIGAFHRAHQAWYTDAAMNGGDRGWAIIGVSLRSAGVAAQMNPQDGLYTLMERSAGRPRATLMGSVRRVLVASEAPEAVVAALAAPATHIVSFTVTEKGYARAPDGGLDLALADATGLYRLLAEGFRRRMEVGLPGLTLLSCDNLAGNGAQLERLIEAYLALRDPGLLDWFAAHCSCPATMVDRIVPATTDGDRAEVREMLGGIEDLACVVTEAFSQWVIEDRFAGPRPRWDMAGASLVADVTPYETAKLRMLNGAHSLLAYAGLARGHTHVHEAIADPALKALTGQLMLTEAMPTIEAAPGQDLGAYADMLLERFANPSLRHSLRQIAIDGSQKIPQRWLATLAAQARSGMCCPAILAGITGWLRHLQGANGPVDDPLAVPLAEAAGSADPLAAIFGPAGVLPSAWQPSEADRRLVADARA